MTNPTFDAVDKAVKHAASLIAESQLQGVHITACDAYVSGQSGSTKLRMPRLGIPPSDPFRLTPEKPHADESATDGGKVLTLPQEEPRVVYLLNDDQVAQVREIVREELALARLNQGEEK